MMHKIFYSMMLIGYAGCSLSMPGWKMKIIGILLIAVNAVMFYK